MKSPIINTREDLDAIQGTPAWTEFMLFLKGTITTKVDTAVRPEGYGTPEYVGETIPPVWAEIENLSTIENFGFAKEDFANITG